MSKNISDKIFSPRCHGTKSSPRCGGTYQLVVKNDEELRWLGRVLIPKLFDGEHYFTIKVNNDETTKFIQGENFSGILALLLWSSMEQDTKNGFEEMNKAIKIISEATK